MRPVLALLPYITSNSACLAPLCGLCFVKGTFLELSSHAFTVIGRMAVGLYASFGLVLRRFEICGTSAISVDSECDQVRSNRSSVSGGVMGRGGSSRPRFWGGDFWRVGGLPSIAL